MNAPSIRRDGLEIARAAYRDIGLYAPNRAPCPIDLSDNTNLFGVPPAARRTLAEAADATLTRYPSLYAGDLKIALARYAGVRPEEIVTGCGSDDVLDSAIRAFTEPGDAIAFAEPTFAMIPIFAAMNGLRPMAVPLKDDGDLDAAALVATGARVIYLCSPNNPTSTAASPEEIERVLREAPGLVILDEAYAEFLGSLAGPAPANAASARGWIADAPGHGRLIVTRTLSKAFGLAGLRIGYAAGAERLIAEVEKSRGPYKVSGPAERAAVAALTEDLEWVSARIAAALENRKRFDDALRGIGLAPLASDANFVLVPVPDAAAAAAAMRRDGVAVRPFPALPRTGDAVRITIGPWDLMEAALAALARAAR